MYMCGDAALKPLALYNEYKVIKNLQKAGMLLGGERISLKSPLL
jgi:hypothetical protein